MERRTFVKSVLGGAAAAGVVGSGVAGASGPPDGIEILTDEYGVSHVYADDLYRLGYGNGYVQARDRLFVMDVLRHIGYGNSARVLGPAQIPSDVQVKRDLYSREEIDEQWANAPETFRAVVEGYADGANRRMVEMASQGELPVEFAALGHAPEPWTPEDTVAVVNYLIGFFGVAGGDELANAGTLLKLEASLGSLAGAYEAYEDVNWLRTRDSHFTSIPADDKVVEGGETVPDGPDDVPAKQLELAAAAYPPEDVEPWGIEADVAIPGAVTQGRREGQGLTAGFKWGSNALVVDGDLSETGAPLLGGGPQTGFFKPPVLYEIGLHGAGFDVSGVGVVGAPAVVIGRSAGGENGDALAWTVTSGRVDQVDTVAVELDPNDRYRYRWDEEWHRMDTHTVTHVASPVPPALGGEPETRVVRQEVARIEEETADGETAVMPVVAWNPEENVAWCQRVTTRYDELTGASLWAQLGRANDLQEFEDGLAAFPFTFNFHVVSESGDVAYYHVGKVPERNDALDHRLPATSEHHRWTGIRRGLGLDTHVRNPSRGYVVNWNNGPATGWRAGDAEQNWGSVHRVDELDHFVREHLGVPAGVPDGRAVREAAREDLSVTDVKVIVSKAALHDASAQHTVPFVVRAARGSDDSQLRAMADELEAWLDDYCPWHDEQPPGPGEPYDPPTDGDDRYVHAGHAVYDETRKALQSLVFRDELGEHAPEIDFEPPASRHAGDHGTVWDDVTFYDALRGATNHDWFDDGTTDSEARRDDLLRRALRRAAARLEERFDTPDPGEWRMEVHESTFLPIGATATERIDMRNRASYNQAVEIRRAQSPDPAVWQANAGDVMPPGNSGHVTADELLAAQATGEEPDRLTNQLPLYVNNEYKPHPVTREQVEAVAVERETLRPTRTPGGTDAP